MFINGEGQTDALPQLRKKVKPKIGVTPILVKAYRGFSNFQLKNRLLNPTNYY